MKKLAWLVVLALAVVVLAGPGRSSRSVFVNYNHAFNFRQVRTYSWGRVRTRNSNWDDEVRLDVNNELRARGLREVPTGGDLTLSVVSTTAEHRSLETFYNEGWGLGWGWRGWRGGPWYAETVPVEYPVDTLVIDFFNPQNKELVWRGTASEALSAGNNARNDQRLSNAVTRLLSKFPPK